MQTFEAYASKADGKEIRICVPNSNLDEKLKALGFIFDQTLSMYVKETSNITEKAKFFDILRGLNICFSDGKEWCPSELFEYFRDQGLIEGTFKRVSWSDPKNFTIQEV